MTSGGRDKLARIALVASSALVAVNIWTGAPLLALWVGSRLVSQTTLSMRGVAIVLVVLAAVIFTMTFLLTWLNARYLELVGPEQRGRWDPELPSQGAWSWRSRWRVLTPVERIVVVTVYLAVLTLLVWFFLLAGSPLPE